MKINLNKIFGAALSFTVLIFASSCMDDDSFSYDVPPQADVAQLTITSVQGDTQCTADFSLTTSDVATVYYLVLPSTDDAPTSEDVFDTGTAIDLSGTNNSFTTADLLSGANYTLYAVTVNKDGVRTNQVFTASYNQPDYEVIVDTSYTSSVTAFNSGFSSHTATFTPTGTPNQYTVNSFWGPNFVAEVFGNPAYENNFFYSGTLTINNDFTVTIVGNEAWTQGGSGTYNPCTNEISYTLNHGLFTATGGVPVPVSVVLTPENL